MAKMIPEYIDQDDPRRDGERLVFQWLSNETIPGVVFYSLLQKNHKHKMIGEIDFLYVCEKGLLCIEVKGGQNIYCKDKQWYSLSKSRMENEIHNPFVQAKDCMYALKKYLIETYGKYSPQANYLIGYAVIFPECKFTGSGNDLLTEVMYDARYELDDFPKFLSTTLDYWAQQEVQKHNYHPTILTTNQLKQTVDLLRGDFCVVPSMNLEMQHVHQQMLRLTEEQFDALDITEENKRVIIQGVAGTGKSLLALEKVRKTAAKGKRVLYICFNRNMAKYATHSLDIINENYVTIATYHALLQQSLNSNSLFNSDVLYLSELFLQHKPSVEQYDCLVIDEAQDLMFASAIDSLGNFLKGGLAQGEWVMFLDPNQNIFNNSDEYDFAWEYIRECFSPTVYKLNQNCRNTEQIGRRTSVLTLVAPAKHMKISGPKVILKSYANSSDLLKKLRAELTSLFAGGASPLDVVILSRYKLENSCLANQRKICNLELNDVTDISKINKASLNFFTIQSFKGLESKVVFVVDVDGFAKDSDRMLNYVAMSRAKVLLYVFYKEEKTEEYREIIEQGQDLLY